MKISHPRRIEKNKKKRGITKDHPLYKKVQAVHKKRDDDVKEVGKLRAKTKKQAKVKREEKKKLKLAHKKARDKQRAGRNGESRKVKESI
jgi:hypothetical protein